VKRFVARITRCEASGHVGLPSTFG
jgi:hypothetical protein